MWRPSLCSFGDSNDCGRSPHGTSEASIDPATAIFQWNNAAQLFNFWFRGFPDNCQTLTAGIQRGRYYFFQATAGQEVPMD